MNKTILILVSLCFSIGVFAQSEIIVYDELTVDRQARYRGGLIEMQKFVRKHMILPDYYWEADTVFEVELVMSLIVNERGCLTHVEVSNLAVIPKDIAEETVAVYHKMACKKWIPAQFDGHRVAMKLTHPLKIVIPAKWRPDQ